MRRQLVESRTEARRAIDAGRVRVSGVPAPKPSTLVAASEPVQVVGPPLRFVGRGGLKLEAALMAWPVAPPGRSAGDVGASTGGFTDCLLQHEAASVVAVDVGYGQLHSRIREDPRVTAVDRTNIRFADASSLGAPFGIVVADLSFISLVTVSGVLAALGDENTDWIVLVKPQFEAGREHVGAGGVIRSPAVWTRTIDQAAEGFAESGVGALEVMASPVTGASGNVEFLLGLRRGRRLLDSMRIGSVVDAVAS